jgi:hypothetical protein
MHERLMHRLPIVALCLAVVAWLFAALGLSESLLQEPGRMIAYPGPGITAREFWRQAGLGLGSALAIAAVVIGLPGLIGGVRRNIAASAIVVGALLIAVSMVAA